MCYIFISCRVQKRHLIYNINIQWYKDQKTQHQAMIVVNLFFCLIAPTRTNSSFQELTQELVFYILHPNALLYICAKSVAL